MTKQLPADFTDHTTTGEPTLSTASSSTHPTWTAPVIHTCISARTPQKDAIAQDMPDQNPQPENLQAQLRALQDQVSLLQESRAPVSKNTLWKRLTRPWKAAHNHGQQILQGIADTAIPDDLVSDQTHPVTAAIIAAFSSRPHLRVLAAALILTSAAILILLMNQTMGH